jgi:ABC-type multidrug transport system fused ATPase/permease subunit
VAATDTALNTRERVRAMARTLAPFMRLHRGFLIRGVIATLVGVALRVVLPWPMRSLFKPWLRNKAHHGHSGMPSWLPDSMDPVWVAGILLLVIMLAMGFTDMRKRLAYARFAIGVSRDLRVAALHAAGADRGNLPAHRAGDMVSRLLGDTARIKNGIRGFLIHITTNLVLLTAVSVVLVYLNWGIGLIFLGALLTTLLITLVASERISVRTQRIREKEGKLADAIHHTWLDRAADADDYGRVMKASSGSHDAGITKIQGFAAWSAHVVFGLAMLSGALLAEHQMRIGSLKASVVLLIVVYALMVRTPLIQLARQGVRLGKVLGSSDRIVAMLERNVVQRANTRALPQLRATLTLRDVVVNGGRAHDKEPVFGSTSLRIQRGERVYVWGGAGSGKSLFAELLAGVRMPDSGQILWDDVDYASVNGDSVRERVSYSAAEPSWSKRSMRTLLGIQGEPDARARQILSASGAQRIIEQLKGGLDAIGTSHEFSLEERRSLVLCRSALRDADLYVWDMPEQKTPCRPKFCIE